ncbi:ribonuclease H-like domain-containing protein [Tanacetum coccineum]
MNIVIVESFGRSKKTINKNDSAINRQSIIEKRNVRDSYSLIARGKFLGPRKLVANGSLRSYKARLVANGNSQQLDDIVLTASSTTLLQRIIAYLYQEFSMTDLVLLNYFLGIFVTCSDKGMTPVDTESKLGADGTPVCLYMYDLREPHLAAPKRILQ